MFSIFKKRPQEQPDLSGIVCDMHSHLVPGVDDGAPDIETSLHLIKGLTDLGYKKLITTPHILWDIYKNDIRTITPPFTELQGALKENKMDVQIKFAAEYFLDDHISDLIEQESPLLTLKDKWVLVEFSFVSAPLDLKEKLFAMEIIGYKPILAHPERYSYFNRDKKIYDELKEAGYLFQLNLLSLTGYYGKGPLELSQYLIKKNYVELLGTDLHHTRQLNALQTSPQLTDIIKALQDSGNLLNPTL